MNAYSSKTAHTPLAHLFKAGSQGLWVIILSFPFMETKIYLVARVE